MNLSFRLSVIVSLANVFSWNTSCNQWKWQSIVKILRFIFDQSINTFLVEWVASQHIISFLLPYILSVMAAAHWKWDVQDEDDVCGICRNPFEGCCPNCSKPGDDCPLSKLLSHFPWYSSTWTVWGECTHVFHMHCLLKWISQESSNQQCPMDRKTWKTQTS